MVLTSSSGMWSHCLGSSSPAKKAIRSRAVSLVCRLDETNTSTGLDGEWDLMAERRYKEKEMEYFVHSTLGQEALENMENIVQQDVFVNNYVSLTTSRLDKNASIS